MEWASLSSGIFSSVLALNSESAESAMAEILAYHGWGFDHTCWVHWVKQGTDRGHRVQCFDRGYWDSPCDPQFSTDLGQPLRLLLLHSFGLHLCPLKTLSAADQIVIFNSFLCFHPDESRLQQRSRRAVDRMGDRLKTHPSEVLQKFWINCYAPIEYSHSALPPFIPPSQERRQMESSPLGIGADHRSKRNQTLLEQDLDALNHVAMTTQSEKIMAIRQTASVTVIHGAADQIVPLSQGAKLADAVSAEWVTVLNVGHALPFSYPELCWSLAPFNRL